MTSGPPDSPTDELLFRYVTGSCSSHEHAEVEGWLRRDPANGRRMEDIRRIRLASRPQPSRDVDRMWTRLHDATRRVESAAECVTEPLRARPARAGGAGRGFTAMPAAPVPAVVVAAAIVLLAGGAFVALRTHWAPVAPARVSVQTYVTGPAQTANIRLRDGSTVRLAPESRLRVPDDYGDHARLVALDGEAFFSVIHDAAAPFRVRAKGAIAEDIGTRFDVRAYDDESGVVVIVADGAVAVGRTAASDTTGGGFAGDAGLAGDARSGAEGAIVRRGERARIGGPDSTTTVDRVPLRVMDWTDGRLTFDRTPLAEIARAIARWYDLDVRVADVALGRRLITADFDAQAPKEMVDALATATGAEVEQHGRVLTIRTKP